MRYPEKQFKDLLSEFISCTEDKFDLIESLEPNLYSEKVYTVLFNKMLDKFRFILSNEIDSKTYGINNIAIVNIGILKYRNDIAKTICLIFISKEHLAILESLRSCKSWNDVIDFYHKFIKIYEDLCQSSFLANTRSTNDEGVLYFVYIIYLALYGAFALNDELYNELNVSKKELNRPRFDYLRNGLPLRTIPYIYNTQNNTKEFNPSKLDNFSDFLVKIEYEFNEYGFLTPKLMSKSEFLCLASCICKEELTYLYAKNEKFKGSIYRYIDLLESSVLSHTDNCIEIKSDSYIKLENFNKVYLKEIQTATTIAEAEEILEKYKEIYENETKELRLTVCEYVSNVLSSVNFFNLDSIVNLKRASTFISKQEGLVLISHLNKLKIMLMNFSKENLDFITPDLLIYFTATENRIAEIKDEIAKNEQKNISIKKINKKIAKYKKAFNFKDINKIAEEAGFQKVRQNGDHGIFKKLDGTTIVIPQGRNIGKGLSFKIQKDIENSKEETIA